MNAQLFETSHKRYNILTDEFVLVSPHRTKRPWQGQVEKIPEPNTPSYDPTCYLCPGNTRSNGQVNPDYRDTFVFENDFSALQAQPAAVTLEEGLLKARTESGVCRVVCFSPDHSKGLSQLSPEHIGRVIETWKAQYEKLISAPEINYVQIFENKGAVMGCSNPHPHGQIWAQNSIPNEILKKDRTQKQYFQAKGASLLGDYLKQEFQLEERILWEDSHFVVLVPFWAVWPFEAMIAPKAPIPDISRLGELERQSFAKALQTLSKAYDRLFDCPFPYSAGIHQSPKLEDRSHWHWHMCFYPPLLRSASVKKFMVGYEMLAMPQRDITPEQAAKRLRELIA